MCMILACNKFVSVILAGLKKLVALEIGQVA